MIYDTLAEYYDALVEDEQATQDWCSFVKRYIKKGSLLELACGSGDLAIALHTQGYAVTAMDQSEDMLAQAQKKDGQAGILWRQGDMRKLSTYGSYDGILCFCDSINYLLKKEEVQQVFAKVYAHLVPKGVFLFDVHSWDRLAEFQDEYCESGHIQDVDYQWSIQAEEDFIYQTFLFYDENKQTHMEQHIQRVFPPKQLLEMLETAGFHTTIFTDFVEEGIQPGEKYFFVCRKDESI